VVAERVLEMATQLLLKMAAHLQAAVAVELGIRLGMAEMADLVLL
jgi:hypothetical protein